jgi:hypothetical protein
MYVLKNTYYVFIIDETIHYVMCFFIIFYIEKTTFRSVFANNSVFNIHFIKVSTENDNNFGYEKITIVVDGKSRGVSAILSYLNISFF